MIDIEKYRDIPFDKRKNCMICGSDSMDPVIELPDFPITEVYVEQNINDRVGFLDQEFYICEKCGHGQISNVIEPEFLYGDSYETRTSTSSSATGAIDSFLDFINDNLRDREVRSIIEIGCNDVYTLNRLKNRAEKLYGIDPILKGREEEYEEDKITLMGDFFENIDLNEMGVEMDVVLSSQTLEHVIDPKNLIRNLMDIATDNTLFFFQFPGLEGLVRDARFDQIFHQHYNYFTLKSVVYMLEELDADLIDFRVNPYHWATLMIAFRKKNQNRIDAFEKYKSFIVQLKREEILSQYKIFKNCMSATSNRIRALRNERLYGYGAALMLPVLDYYLEDGLSILECILDEDRNKVGKYYLNVPIQIVHPDEINNIEDSVIVLTAINSLDTGRRIIPKLIALNVKQIIVPLNSI